MMQRGTCQSEAQLHLRHVQYRRQDTYVIAQQMVLSRECSV
jgi:hypothetical protein